MATGGQIVRPIELALAIVVGPAEHLAVIHVGALLAAALAVHFANLVATLQRITSRCDRFVAVILEQIIANGETNGDFINTLAF